MSTTAMSDAQRRRQSIRDTSGRYAHGATASGEADVDLSGPAPTLGELVAAQDAQAEKYGQVGVETGSRTPWGPADQIEHCAPGIVFASTASHGGYKLSAERNRAIPAPLRRRGGWYEEDCEAHIVGAFHPEAMAHSRSDDRDPDRIRADEVASVKEWFPDEWSAATGEQVAPEESGVLRRRASDAEREAFHDAHADEFVSIGGAAPERLAWTPDGCTSVVAQRRTTGEERIYLARRGLWDDHRTNPQLVEGRELLDVTDIVADNPGPDARPAPAPVEDLGIDYSMLTPTAAERARKELDTYYRGDDGSIRTLAQIIEDRRATSKYYWSTGRETRYAISGADGLTTSVSKSAYQALTGVPEQMSRLDLAEVEVNRAEHAAQKADDAYQQARRSARSRDDAKKQRAASDRARQRLQNAEETYATRNAERLRIRDWWYEAQRKAIVARAEQAGFDLDGGR